MRAGDFHRWEKNKLLRLYRAKAGKRERERKYLEFKGRAAQRNRFIQEAKARKFEVTANFFNGILMPAITTGVDVIAALDACSKRENRTSCLGALLTAKTKARSVGRMAGRGVKRLSDADRIRQLNARLARNRKLAVASRKRVHAAGTALSRAVRGKAYAFPGPLADPEVYKAVVELGQALLRQGVNSAGRFIIELNRTRVAARMAELTQRERNLAKKALREARRRNRAHSWQPKNSPRAGKWKRRRTHQPDDKGLKDHARRHSDVSPGEYLKRGQETIAKGRVLKGGGRYPNARYHVRKVGDDAYSVTITDKRGEILSIDTWKHGSAPLTKARVIDALEKSGVTPPKGFWEKL